jgi:hypothetical protein
MTPAPRNTTENSLPSPAPNQAASLSPSKVAAGGLAAATTSVLGSYFGVFGTVGGAAAGAVATTVSTTIYQRSIEHTRTSLRTQARHGHAALVRSTRSAQRRDVTGLLISVLLGTLAIFALGIGVVTGIEWLKGGPLSGGSHGSSVGRVLDVAHLSTQAPQHARDEKDRGETPPTDPRAPGERDQPQTPSGVGGLLPGQSGQSSDRTPSSEQPDQPQTPGGVGGLLPGQ